MAQRNQLDAVVLGCGARAAEWDGSLWWVNGVDEIEEIDGWGLRWTRDGDATVFKDFKDGYPVNLPAEQLFTTKVWAMRALRDRILAKARELDVAAKDEEKLLAMAAKQEGGIHG